MRLSRKKRVIAAFALVFILSTILVFSLRNQTGRLQSRHHVELLWWAGMSGFKYDEVRTCGYYSCRFSNNRERLSQAWAVLFYASNLLAHDMPIPRSERQPWALLHDESPRNVPYLPHQCLLQHFNYTSTFSRHSDLALTTQYLPRITDLTTDLYKLTFAEKKVRAADDDLAPVVFLQSDCDTMSGREDYVRQLMQHIRVDSYGSCLHNKDLPANLQADYLNNLYSPELLRFLARYRFTLAIENGVCADYITEKFWRPLIVGSVPIYFGASTIRDWQPNEKSVIYIEDFETPEKLAQYLVELERNRTAYDEYMRHKLNGIEAITNNLLLQTLKQRRYAIADDQTLFEAFECAVCERMVKHNEPVAMAGIRHYDCPVPPVRVPLKDWNGKSATDWAPIMSLGRCQAELLDQYWRRNEPYTQEQLRQALEERSQAGQC